MLQNDIFPADIILKIACYEERKKGDRLYTIMTVLAVLAFWGHNYFLVIDYFLVFLISLASIVCISAIMADSLLCGKKENQYRYMYKIAGSCYTHFVGLRYTPYGFAIQSETEKQNASYLLTRIFILQELMWGVFRFEGDKFDRKYDIQELADKHGRDLLDSHEVHLTLKEVLPDVYYLDNISVKAKNNLQNK